MPQCVAIFCQHKNVPIMSSCLKCTNQQCKQKRNALSNMFNIRSSTQVNQLSLSLQIVHFHPPLVTPLVSSLSDFLHVQGLENCLCVMRNLSYQLYTELPPSVRLRLEGPTRGSAIKDSEAIGCFTLYSKKDTEVRFITGYSILCPNTLCPAHS